MTRDEVREQIAEILASFKQDRDCMYPKGCADCDGSWFCLKNCLVLQDYLNKILSLVAIVDREADRRICNPDLHYDSAIRYEFKHEFYVKISEGWVKEVSDV